MEAGDYQRVQDETTTTVNNKDNNLPKVSSKKKEVLPTYLEGTKKHWMNSIHPINESLAEVEATSRKHMTYVYNFS